MSQTSYLRGTENVKKLIAQPHTKYVWFYVNQKSMMTAITEQRFSIQQYRKNVNVLFRNCKHD